MTKFEKDQLFSVVQCHIIDTLIIEILEDGEKDYKDLGYVQKTTLCKLMKKKCNLYGRALA